MPWLGFVPRDFDNSRQNKPYYRNISRHVEVDLLIDDPKRLFICFDLLHKVTIHTPFLGCIFVISLRSDASFDNIHIYDSIDLHVHIH